METKFANTQAWQHKIYSVKVYIRRQTSRIVTNSCKNLAVPKMGTNNFLDCVATDTAIQNNMQYMSAWKRYVVGLVWFIGV